jgi:hypothetical protein
MAMGTYRAALAHARWYQDRGTQGELSLTGIGEATLHPAFVELVALAREALPDQPLTIATNGLLVTDALCRAIAPYRPQLFISLHRPEAAGPAIAAATRHGILAGVNAAFATSSLDWAGQVPWHVSAPTIVCEFLRTGWGVVLVDGRITTCCLDAAGSGVVGTVLDPPGMPPMMRPYDLCAACHMTIPVDAELLVLTHG